MLSLSIAVCLLIAGSLDASDECRGPSPPQDTCNNADLPEEFPGTAEEFELFCNGSIPYLECKNMYLERCLPGDDYHQDIQEILSILRDICEKDTPIHEAIVNSISCLKSRTMDIVHCTIWSDDTRFITEDFENLILAQGIESVSDEEEKALCLRRLYDMACAAASAGQFCGQTAKATVLEIVQRLGFQLRNCNPELVEQLPTIVDVLERERGKQEELEEIFERK